MATVGAARSLFRSSTAAAASRSATSRFSGSQPKSNPFSQSPFHLPKQKPLSPPRICRSPVELGACLESLLPYHTATASALLTSMLSVTPRGYGWTLEDG